MAINELKQRVERRLKELKIGPVEAAESVRGLERNYIRDLLDDRKQSFNQGKLPLVAEALRWTVGDLLGDQIAAKQQERPAGKIIRVPLLDTVTAGKLRAPSSQIPVEDVPLLAYADLGRGEWFALRVEDKGDGDSMDRLSPPGSIIIVNKADRDLRSGRCYIFSIGGETTYKMWQDGDPPYLAPYSTNPIHKPIFVKRQRDFEVIGRVKRTVLDL
ncbi:MAG: S24 family peptidase [Afipia felis]|nr:S24 family peptidase [Afipia felis]